MKKKLLAILLCAIALVSMLTISASAGVVYYHGNDNSRHRVYALTTQSGTTYAIGAKITWQIQGQSAVITGPYNTSTGAQALSESPSLWLKKGQSFGYYYINGSQTHQSTAWMNFDF